MQVCQPVQSATVTYSRLTGFDVLLIGFEVLLIDRMVHNQFSITVKILNIGTYMSEQTV